MERKLMTRFLWLVAVPLGGAIVLSICLALPRVIYGIFYIDNSQLIMSVGFFVAACSVFFNVVLSMRCGEALGGSPYGRFVVNRRSDPFEFWICIATQIAIGLLPLVLSIFLFVES